jgi:hypothetical protein
MLANINNYGDRISAGKETEAKILNALRRMGQQISDPTPEEDKYKKIDGWWDLKGTKRPVQVKFRETGDDILFELVKDIDRNIEGRDMISEADLYLVVDRMGTTRVFLTRPIKEKAKEILNIVEKDRAQSPFKVNWWGTDWQVKMQVDRAHGQRKLVAYFDPKLFNALATWKLNIH